MDNITHSLTGVAIAELVLPRGASSGARRVFMASGIAAANLPDLDLVYTAITPGPLGYLLHHRGHTHTIAGLVALGAVMALVYRAWPAVRALSVPERRRLLALVAINLIGHVSLDAFNSYGVHPFYPFANHWIYGDAVFIFEPWIWMFLGVAATWNARRKLTARTTAALITVPIAAAGTFGLVPLPFIALLLAGVTVVSLGMRGLAPRARSAAALASMAIVMFGLLGTSRVVRAAVLAATAHARAGRPLDVIVNPNPAAPLCWQAIIVELDGPADQLTLRRGTLSLAPRWFPPARCASHQFARGAAAGAGVSWAPLDEPRQSVTTLRALQERDCRVRAWLQFGRAPIIRNRSILDLRFDSGRGGNFTLMDLESESSSGCPPAMTNWGTPRADVLQLWPQ